MVALSIAALGVGGGAAGATTPTVPGTPTISAAAAGVQNATVSFDPPADNGGAPVFAYSVTCTATTGSLRATSSGAASPIRVGGMAVGTPYTCRVAARSSVGLGPLSAKSDTVVPLVSVRRARPDPPIDVSAIAAVKSIRIDYSLAPEPPTFRPVHGRRGKCTSSDGGVPATRRVHLRLLVVGPLTPGKTYTCVVSAGNNNGFGAYSARSNAVVPLPAPPTLGAPTVTSVTAGTRSITVAFEQPTPVNGQPILHDRATCASSDGGITNARTGVTSPIIVLGLSFAKTYTCTVVAHDRAGDGPPSPPSASVVTPAS